MAFIVRIPKEGTKVYVGEDGYDEVEGVDLVEIHTNGKSLPIVDEYFLYYEDDEYRSVDIGDCTSYTRLGRPRSGVQFYLSSWHGPAPLPEEWRYEGKPGDFVVARSWNAVTCRQHLSLYLWIEGNRPEEPLDWFWGGIEED